MGRGVEYGTEGSAAGVGEGDGVIVGYGVAEGMGNATGRGVAERDTVALIPVGLGMGVPRIGVMPGALRLTGGAEIIGTGVMAGMGRGEATGRWAKENVATHKPIATLKKIAFITRTVVTGAGERRNYIPMIW